MYQPRVLSIQDISCFGKCSLTVALPVISAMGVETAILPTAVLSTHTGGFTGFTFRDLTDDVEPICAHWKKEGITFGSIYTGYLGSFRQLELVGQIFDDFGKGALKLVDPVMGDNGKLYTGFDENFAKGMAKLCGKADIIVPNLTEACYMLGIPYPGDCSREYAKELLKKLTSLGCRIAVLTGVMDCGGKKHGVMAYNSETGEYSEYYSDHVDAKFHGTGDVWASSFCGALALGKTMDEALKIAVEYTVACIKISAGDDEHKYGVRFEECIPLLVDLIGKNK